MSKEEKERVRSAIEAAESVEEVRHRSFVELRGNRRLMSLMRENLDPKITENVGSRVHVSSSLSTPACLVFLTDSRLCAFFCTVQQRKI